MKRKIIEIDEENCDGCELCIPSCPEGAIHIVSGKAKLVKDFYCDGLGSCIGKCPQGAISVIEREAEGYDEKATLKNIMNQGDDAVQHHFEHLREHNEIDLLEEAEQLLLETKKIKPTLNVIEQSENIGGCPGSKNMEFNKISQQTTDTDKLESMLNHWPIQMHLISPQAPQYRNSHLLLAADCVSFSLGDFHQKYLKDKTLAIACPKLDQNQQVYINKLVSLIDDSKIQSISVMIMQVPCCSGLVSLVQQALQIAKRDIPVIATIVGIRGDILNKQKLN